MPHVTIKLYPGKTEEQKKQLTEKIVADIEAIMGSSAKSVSVSFQEVDPTAWPAEVYDPEIVGKQETLYKRPGYGSLAAADPATR